MLFVQIVQIPSYSLQAKHLASPSSRATAYTHLNQSRIESLPVDRFFFARNRRAGLETSTRVLLVL